MKKAKTAYIISAIIMILLFVGGIVNYILTGAWDGELSGIMACNTAIFVKEIFAVCVILVSCFSSI